MVLYILSYRPVLEPKGLYYIGLFEYTYDTNGRVD